MTRLAARVAATVGGTTADAKSRAVGLDVTETLAVVALLGWIRCKHMSEVARASRTWLTLSGPGVRAGVALVAFGSLARALHCILNI